MNRNASDNTTVSPEWNLLQGAAFKLRGLVMTPLLVGLAICTWHEIENGWLVWGVGLAVMGAGIALRIWAQRYLRYRLDRQRRLAVTGPYRYVRNPVYIGNLLVLAGMSVLCELVWAIPIVLLCAGSVYALAIGFEEARLIKHYGEDYVEYARNVPRWLPRIPGSLRTVSLQHETWRAAFAAEWQCLVLLLIPSIKEYVTHVLL